MAVRASATRRGTRPRSPFRRGLDIALALAILAVGALVVSRLDRVAEMSLGGAATVGDGDSITLDGERIRLVGIDAPEFGQTCRRGDVSYDCGREARQSLVGLIGDRTVTCQGWERDRYGRLLARCRAGDVDLNREQVLRGWAVAYGDYGDAEETARNARIGLWSGAFERPRDWRTSHGGMAETPHDLFASLGNWLAAIFLAR